MFLNASECPFVWDNIDVGLKCPLLSGREKGAIALVSVGRFSTSCYVSVGQGSQQLATNHIIFVGDNRDFSINMSRCKGDRFVFFFYHLGSPQSGKPVKSRAGGDGDR